MYGLGLRLALQGGREAAVRLLLTICAVALGAVILLGVLADFHAFQVTSSRASWESTSGVPVGSAPSGTPNALLWNYSENIYKGRFIEQLDVAALSPQAPRLPGITALPGPGQFYASPALAGLLQTVPHDELGDRFPGRQIGTIGQAALSFPTELVVYVGRTPAQMKQMNTTIVVTHIATAPQLQGTTNIYREAFGVAALAVLFPLVILVGTATRLAAARREERYAAMRLVGATPLQVSIIASVDAIVGSSLGAVAGVVLFLALRPVIANVALSGVRFFPDYVTPTVWGYVAMVVAVPVVAALASLVSLRRVRISPLGASRKATPVKPRAWRLIPLVAGIGLFLFAATHVSRGSNGTPLPLMAGFLLIMIGMVLSGSWLTMQLARGFARLTGSAASLLAARRLADDPKGAFRTVSGLVLAVFIGSVVSVLVPALSYAQNPTGQVSLNNVMRVPYNTGPHSTGLGPAASAALVGKMQSYAGTVVVPIYTNPAFVAFTQQNLMSIGVGQNRHDILRPGVQPPDNSIVGCASVRLLPVLGRCPAGAVAVTFDASSLLGGDNPLYIYKSIPIVTASSPAAALDTHELSLAGLLLQNNNPNMLERIRTYLTVYNAGSQGGIAGGKGGDSLSAWQMGVFEPETIGEVAAIRNNDDANIGRAVLAVVALTLVTAGCSMAVTIGGSLVERKRPFTLLRVSGAPIGVLYRVVLLEAALPLAISAVFAAAIGVGVGVPAVRALLAGLAPSGMPVYPSAGYIVAMAAGLAAALLLVAATLPLLGSVTRPEDARFE